MIPGGTLGDGLSGSTGAGVHTDFHPKASAYQQSKNAVSSCELCRLLPPKGGLSGLALGPLLMCTLGGGLPSYSKPFQGTTMLIYHGARGKLARHGRRVVETW